jgi:hypothetical protein
MWTSSVFFEMREGNSGTPPKQTSVSLFGGKIDEIQLRALDKSLSDTERYWEKARNQESRGLGVDPTLADIKEVLMTHLESVRRSVFPPPSLYPGLILARSPTIPDSSGQMQEPK